MAKSFLMSPISSTDHPLFRNNSSLMKIPFIASTTVKEHLERNPTRDILKEPVIDWDEVNWRWGTTENGSIIAGRTSQKTSKLKIPSEPAHSTLYKAGKRIISLVMM